MIKFSKGQILQCRYRIESELGSGGMGVVYLATQLDADRLVALKVLRLERVGQEGEYERFLREFSVLSRLSHPNIVAFHSHGLTSEGIPFAACQYVAGKTLQSVLAEQEKLEWRRASKIVLQIADGLAYAHSLGVIHRDLKPGNIMLSENPEPDSVKIIDFGLARVENSSELAKLTLTGTLLGSLHYMSPEQCRAEVLDSKSDTYSLACLFFEMLSGQKLFEAQNPVAVLNLHCHSDAGQRLQSLDDSVNPALISVLASMLSKSPQSRPSMLEIINLLNELLNSEALAPASLGAARSSSKVHSANARIVLMVSSFAFLAVIVCGLFIGSSRHERAVAIKNDKNSDSLVALLPRDFEALYEKTFTVSDLSKRRALIEAWLKKFSRSKSIPAKDKLEAYVTLAPWLPDAERKECEKKGLALLSSIDETDARACVSRVRILVCKANREWCSGRKEEAVKSLNEAARPYLERQVKRTDCMGIIRCVCALTNVGSLSKALELQLKSAEILEGKDDYSRTAALFLLNNSPEQALIFYLKAYDAALESVNKETTKLKGISKTLGTRESVVFGLKTGARVSSMSPSGNFMRQVLNRIRRIDRKTAETLIVQTVNTALSESERGIKYSNIDWSNLRGLADKLNRADLSRLCLNKEIAAVHNMIADLKEPTDVFNRRAELACFDICSGDRTKGYRDFQKLCTDCLLYRNSANFDEAQYLLRNLEMAKIMLQLNHPEKQKQLDYCRNLLAKPAAQLPPVVFVNWGLILSLNHEAASQSFFKKAESMCLQEAGDCKSWQAAAWSFIEADQIQALETVLKNKLALPEQQKEARRFLIRLAEQRLDNGRAMDAKQYFERAYCLSKNSVTDLEEFPEDLETCKLGILAVENALNSEKK